MGISDRAAKMQQLNSVNKKNLQKIAEELSSDKKLRFDRTEIEKLLIKFTKLTTGNQKQLIDRNQFRDLLHDSFCMTEEILMDRVFRAFDEDLDGYISREEMFQLLKHCLVKQPAEEDPDEGIKELV